MALRQSCPLGGSITLNATDTANTYVLDLPAQNATLATLDDIPSPFPSGTVMIFAQAAAPTGWTKVTTYNDYALRVVSGAGGGTGGSVAFTSAFANTNSGATTLSLSQIPSHTHTGPVIATWYTGGGNPSPGHAFGYGTQNGATGGSLQSLPAYEVANTSLAVSADGGGASHTHSLSLGVQYIDTILASKN